MSHNKVVLIEDVTITGSRFLNDKNSCVSNNNYINFPSSVLTFK